MSDDKVNLPDGDTCQKFCEQFAEITQTDTIYAQIYLQDKDWNLERAIADFYESANNNQETGKKLSDTIVISDDDGDDDDDNLSQKSAVDNKKRDLKFITWNSDGLNEKNLLLRTKRICKTIKTEHADIVFLQEVVPNTTETIEKALPGYSCIWGNSFGYFTGTLLNKDTVCYMGQEIHEYPSSRMERNLLQVDVKVNDVPLILFNTHLESTKDGQAERVSQLKMAFDKALNVPSDKTVLLAGDFNLRDKELESIGSLPTGIEDVWITCGKRKECTYTWDMTRNDNLNYNSGSRFRPRYRFDRVLLKQSSPLKISPKYFGLIGLERLLPHRCFPSDHWGILCHFQFAV